MALACTVESVITPVVRIGLEGRGYGPQSAELAARVYASIADKVIREYFIHFTRSNYTTHLG